MERFLQIQIYNALNTQVEYDNAVDTDWGINAGTADLNQIMMNQELSYGEYNSAIFQVTVFGLAKNIKLNGRKIVVNLIDGTTTSPLLLSDENSEPITTDEGNYIIAKLPGSVSNTIKLFTGIINSSETDILKTDRRIVAYDRAYTDKDIQITSWWNTWWKSKIGIAVTIVTFRNALLDNFNIPFVNKSLINDSIVIPNPFKAVTDEDITYTLTVGDVLPMICRLQNCTPCVNGEGQIEFLSLGGVTYDITGDTEGLNSNWVDYETEKITGVAFYGDNTDPVRVVGTTTNVYVINGNLLTLNMTTATLDTIGTNILNGIKDIQYVPSRVRMKISRPEFKLGDKVITDEGNCYIMQHSLTGSLLINQELDSVAVEATLNKDITNYNDVVMKASKTASIEKAITDTKAEVVLKATANGRIVTVALGADASTGSSFSVTADDIAFIANGKIELSANNLEINSTNFKVTSAGAITATSGNIGGWNINNTSLYYGGSTISRDGSITLRQSSSANSGLICDYDGIHWYRSSTSKTDVLYVDSNTGYVVLEANDIIYQGNELSDLFNDKPDKTSFHDGATVVTFSNGEGSIPFSTIGVTSKPEGLLVASGNSASILVTYIYDQSTSEVKLWAYDVANGGWYNGDVKVIYSCSQWL